MNATDIEVAARGLAMALLEHRRKTGLNLEPAEFEIHIHPETWNHWRALADWRWIPQLQDGKFLGFTIAFDREVPEGHLVLKCIWQMTVL